MANRADVTVKNSFTGASVNVHRLDPNEIVELEKSVGSNCEEVINLPDTNVKLKVFPPAGMDLKMCKFNVDAAVDMEVISHRTGSYWTLKIIPNELDPETPTTVNVELGGTEPE